MADKFAQNNALNYRHDQRKSDVAKKTKSQLKKKKHGIRSPDSHPSYPHPVSSTT